MKNIVKGIARKMSLEIHQTSPRVLSIQSHVVHGHAGNKSATFPLQLLGFEVDPINTVQFSTHSGYKHRRGTILSNQELADLMEGLALNEVDYYTHLLTGYTRNPESLQQVAKIVKLLKEKNPDLIYVCDPVMGDNGHMYVPEEILPVYQDTIVPIADILTPNQYEAELLTGVHIHNVGDALKVVGLLHDKGVKTVVISSSELGDENHMIALASTNNNECYQITFPKIKSPFTGTGDLFTALFCAWFYKSNGDLKSTLENTISTIQGIIRDTYDGARAIYKTDKMEVTKLELRIIQNKRIIEHPKVEIFATPLSDLKNGHSA